MQGPKEKQGDCVQSESRKEPGVMRSEVQLQGAQMRLWVTINTAHRWHGYLAIIP